MSFGVELYRGIRHAPPFGSLIVSVAFVNASRQSAKVALILNLRCLESRFQLADAVSNVQSA